MAALQSTSLAALAALVGGSTDHPSAGSPPTLSSPSTDVHAALNNTQPSYHRSHVLQRHQQQQVQQLHQQIEQLRQYVRGYHQLIEGFRLLPQKLQHKVLQPLTNALAVPTPHVSPAQTSTGTTPLKYRLLPPIQPSSALPLAYIPATLTDTNRVTVSLGCNYFTELSAHDAIHLIHKRIQGITQRIHTLLSEVDRIAESRVMSQLMEQVQSGRIGVDEEGNEVVEIREDYESDAEDENSVEQEAETDFSLQKREAASEAALPVTGGLSNDAFAALWARLGEVEAEEEQFNQQHALADTGTLSTANPGTSQPTVDTDANDIVAPPQLSPVIRHPGDIARFIDLQRTPQSSPRHQAAQQASPVSASKQKPVTSALKASLTPKASPSQKKQVRFSEETITAEPLANPLPSPSTAAQNAENYKPNATSNHTPLRASTSSATPVSTQHQTAFTGRIVEQPVNEVDTNRAARPLQQSTSTSTTPPSARPRRVSRFKQQRMAG